MILLKESLAVMIGGAFGSLGRFGLSRWIQGLCRHYDYPWGIFACNVLGCLIIGVLAAIFIHRYPVGAVWRAGILIGVLGGFTTFSSFSIDTVTLLQQGDILSAFANVILTLLFCLVATAGGLFITNLLLTG